MCKNERYTREIQRLREENAELKELYETYRERCEMLSVLTGGIIVGEYDYPTDTTPIENTEIISYNGDIDNGVQGGDTNGK